MVDWFTIDVELRFPERIHMYIMVICGEILDVSGVCELESKLLFLRDPSQHISMDRSHAFETWRILQLIYKMMYTYH